MAPYVNELPRVKKEISYVYCFGIYDPNEQTRHLTGRSNRRRLGLFATAEELSKGYQYWYINFYNKSPAPMTPLALPAL